MRFFNIILAALGGILLHGCAGLETLQLAKDARTDYAIVFTAKEKEAADELKEHLDKITGADFKLVAEEDAAAVKAPAFYVGQTKFAASKGIDFGKFHDQEWLVRTIGKDIVIGGGKTRGTLYGVYDLLENKFGCHWYSYDTTEIPANKNLTLENVSIRKEPSFSSRDLFDYYYYSWLEKKEFRNQKCLSNKRNRASLAYGTMAIWPVTSRQYYDVHNFYAFINPKKYFKDHPEYFSMDASGKRYHGTLGPTMQGGQICMSNPDVVDIVYNSLVGFIKADRTKLPQDQWPTMYDISQMDGTAFICLCPKCKAITEREGSEAGLQLAFMNELARRIAGDYPEITIRTLAYGSTKPAPKHIKTEKNILIRWCDSFAVSDCFRPLSTQFNAGQKAEFEAWIKIGANIAVADYWNMGTEFFESPRVETVIDAIIGDLRYFHTNNVATYFCEVDVDEQDNQPNFIGLHLWLAYQLMLDIDQDEEMLIGRFLEGYYGPAAEPMGKFLAMLRKGVKETPTKMTCGGSEPRPYCTEQFMKTAWNYLQQAYNAAPEGSVYRSNVQKEMLTPIYVILRNKWAIGDRKEMIAIYKNTRLKYIERINQGQQALRLRWLNRLKTNLNSFEMVKLPVPKGFEGREIRLLGWPNLCWFKHTTEESYAADPDSIAGKALLSRKPRHYEKPTIHSTTTPGAGEMYSTAIGVYDYGTKKSISIDLRKDLPQDEKYHWYKIGVYELTPGTFVWGFYWQTQCSLAHLCLPPGGKADANNWEVWVSLKFTGPGYVNGSTRTNEIYWDQVMLVKPDEPGK